MSLHTVKDLVDENRELRGQLAKTSNERDALAREREALLRELARMRSKVEDLEGKASMFPHWVCLGCGVVNGEAKERLAFCRCCGAERPR